MNDELQQEQEPEDQDVSQDEAEAYAAFVASFDDERDDESPSEESEQDKDAEENADAEEQDDKVEADEAKAEPPSAGVTDDQLTAMLAKLPKIEEVEQMTSAEIRKLHGKFGEVNRALLELQKSNETRQAASKVKLTRLRDGGYEDFADMLEADFGESQTGGEQPDIGKLVDERVQAMREETEKKMQISLLTIMHKDWTTVKDSDDFKVWVQTIPDDDKVKMSDSWDAMYLGDKFTEFKSWRDKKNQGSQQRKERLERAITPKGAGQPVKSSAMTEEDWFLAALKR